MFNKITIEQILIKLIFFCSVFQTINKLIYDFW